jgi:hypothetical protein
MDDEMTLQLKKAEDVMKKKQAKVNKKGCIFDSANYEL